MGQLTRNIRHSIMADKTLSTYAHNVKIISQHGTVILKGPVKSDAEKKAVMANAVEVTHRVVSGAGDVSSSGEKAVSSHGVAN